MYENITHLRFAPSAFDRGWAVVKEQIAPVLRRQTGLLHLALLPNRAMGTVSILSIWASPACSRAVEFSAALRRAIAALDGLLEPEPRAAPTYRPEFAPVSRN